MDNNMLEVPKPHVGMPEEVKKLYKEAACYFDGNPVLAQSLIYVTLNRMLNVLGVDDPSDLLDTLSTLVEHKQLFMSNEQIDQFKFFYRFSDPASLTSADYVTVEGFQLVNSLIESTVHYNEEHIEEQLQKFHYSFSKIIRKSYKQTFLHTVFRGESRDYGASAMVQGIARRPYGNTDPYDRRVFTKIGMQSADLLNAFKRKASELLGIQVASKGDSEWWILAQHYGVPTRLLDWTTNPLVALYFAIEKKDGLITVTNKDWDDGAFYYLEDIHVFESLSDFDLSENVWAHKEHSNPEETFSAVNYYEDDIFFIRPEYLDTRYKNQSTVLMFPKEQFVDHKPTLEYEKLVIPKEIKHELRAYLRSIGITGDFIYPSLDGASSASRVEVLDSTGPIIGLSG